MAVEFDIFKGNIKELKEKLIKEQEKVEKFSSKLVDDFAKQTMTNIQTNASNIGGMASVESSQEIAELGETQSKVMGFNQIEEISKNHSKIFNTTEEATYAEFGTGMIGSSTPHPNNSMGWEYDLNAHGSKGWRFIGIGGRLVHTKGYPAFATYHNSFEDTKQDLEFIAGDTFKGVLEMMKNDMFIVNDILEEMYQELKTDIRSEQDLYYNTFVFKQPPASPVIPNIQVKSRGIPISENLGYEERKFSLMIDVDIFSQDTRNYDRRTIGEDLQEKVYDFFFHEKGFNCTFNNETPNLDSNVHRILLRFRGVYDLDTGILYRR